MVRKNLGKSKELASILVRKILANHFIIIISIDAKTLLKVVCLAILIPISYTYPLLHAMLRGQQKMHEFTIEAMIRGYCVAISSYVGGGMDKVLLVLHSQAKMNC